jgi:hypothetical protein
MWLWRYKRCDCGDFTPKIALATDRDPMAKCCTCIMYRASKSLQIPQPVSYHRSMCIVGANVGTDTPDAGDRFLGEWVLVQYERLIKTHVVFNAPSVSDRKVIVA